MGEFAKAAGREAGHHRTGEQTVGLGGFAGATTPLAGCEKAGRGQTLKMLKGDGSVDSHLIGHLVDGPLPLVRIKGREDAAASRVPEPNQDSLQLTERFGVHGLFIASQLVQACDNIR